MEHAFFVAYPPRKIAVDSICKVVPVEQKATRVTEQLGSALLVMLLDSFILGLSVLSLEMCSF